jgi:hypothetical protein
MKLRRWSPEEDAALERLYQTLSVPRVTVELNKLFPRAFSESGVTARLYVLRHGWKHKHQKRIESSEAAQSARAAEIAIPIEFEDEAEPAPVPTAPPSRPAVEPAASVDRLMAAIKRVKSFEALCDYLDVSPKRLRETIAEARAAGYGVDLAGDTVAVRPAEPSSDVTDISVVSQPGEPRMFAVASDLHFGSKYHLRSYLLDFIGNAYERGVRLILLPGDNLDGCYRHGRWELTHHGFKDQADDFLSGLPRHKGLRYIGITGNHDETFEKESGLVVHYALNDMARARGRNDFELLGARGAYIRLKAPGERRGCVVELWHPLKGPAYALTYGMQKHVEAYPVGRKPDMLFTGHWHQACYFVSRGVHCFSSGTFQGGGSSFGKALGGAPTIGGWAVRYALTGEGTVRDVDINFRSYYETETPREVEL